MCQSPGPRPIEVERIDDKRVLGQQNFTEEYPRVALLQLKTNLEARPAQRLPIKDQVQQSTALAFRYHDLGLDR